MEALIWGIPQQQRRTLQPGSHGMAVQISPRAAWAADPLTTHLCSDITAEKPVGHSDPLQPQSCSSACRATMISLPMEMQSQEGQPEHEAAEPLSSCPHGSEENCRGTSTELVINADACKEAYQPWI